MATRKIASDPLLNSRMKRHIKSLGLSSVESYRKWCREHGFSPELSKNLRQIEEESRASRKAQVSAADRKSLDAHIGALGFDSIEQYTTWCVTVGLNSSLNKSAAQRKNEIDIKKRHDFERSDRDYARAKGDTARAIRNIISGRPVIGLITHPGLLRVAELFDSEDTRNQYGGVFLRLVDSVIDKGDFLDVNPVIARFAGNPGNTIVDGLFAVALHAESWIRTPESWQPRHKGLHKRFGELTRHLFAGYQVPEFFDSVWFSGAGDEALTRQGWFIHVGGGGNIRTAGLPMAYTKKMSHHFLEAPASSTVIEALRWGQVLALGGAPELAEHINATVLGERLEHEDFWISVVHFFVNNPMLDLSYVEPIVEYIRHRKFIIDEQQAEDGAVPAVEPPDPGFSMKGRQADPLIELVDEWRNLVFREQKARAAAGWEPSGIPSFEYLEESRNGMYRWTIDEVTTRKELILEAKRMKHCVRSYQRSCERGIKSVWSMQREDMENGSKTRVLTIAVKNDVRRVVQARGKCNAMPGHHLSSQQAERELRRSEELLTDGRRIMQKWGIENDIDVPRYT